VAEPSFRLASEAVATLGSAAVGNSLCDWKETTSVSSRAVPPRLRYASPSGLSIASGTSSVSLNTAS
jgi:hypothetical protein